MYVKQKHNKSCKIKNYKNTDKMIVFILQINILAKLCILDGRVDAGCSWKTSMNMASTWKWNSKRIPCVAKDVHVHIKFFRTLIVQKP